jgi:DNA-directed RNA polymerase beta' subunit
MTRYLTDTEINDILSFIKPQTGIPADIAANIVNSNKERLKKQLVNVKVYPGIIADLRRELENIYNSSIIHPGESVGVVCAQSIGEKQTQASLNSVDWDTPLFYYYKNRLVIETIGVMVDRLLLKHADSIKHIPKNWTEYLELEDSVYYIPSTNEDGYVNWYKIEAVTRHLPTGKLVKVTTQSGRTVVATQSKSFLTWSNDTNKWVATYGSKIDVGDILPVTVSLQPPLDITSIDDKSLMDGFLYGLFLGGMGYLNEDNDITIPQYAFIGRTEFTRGLLDGYFSSCCTITPTDELQVISSYGNLLYSIYILLSYYGIFSNVRKISCLEDVMDKWVIVIQPPFIHKFYLYIGLTDTDKYTSLRQACLKNPYPVSFNLQDVVGDPVVKIEYLEHGTTDHVYDLTVEHTRNFQILNGLNMADTFHKCGASEKTVTTGVPRFQELINATKKPRIVNNKIYFKAKPQEIEHIRDITNEKCIVGLTFSDITTTIQVCLDKEDEVWYDPYKILYNDEFSKYDNCISLTMDPEILYKYKITMSSIAEFIHEEYDDLFCVFSPDRYLRMDIFVDTTSIQLPDDKMSFITEDNIISVYMEECVLSTIENMSIRGIQGITDIFYTTDEQNEWFAETNGINSRSISSNYVNFKKLLSLPTVDETRTSSNNVWDIYEVLGIEAARAFLIEEFMSIMDGINPCHTCLLVDRMAHNGSIASITRYTMKKDESGPFGRASFEETMDNFLNAASRGETEPTEGVSASIICGKRSSVGTGMIDLKVDLDYLINNQTT